MAKLLLFSLAIMVGLFVLGALYPVGHKDISYGGASGPYKMPLLERVQRDGGSQSYLEQKFSTGAIPKGTTVHSMANPGETASKIRGALEGNYYRIGSVQIQVNNFLETYDKIEDMLSKNDAEILESNVRGSDDFRQGYILARVPKKNFREVIKNVRGYGKVESEEIQSQLVENPRTESDNKRLETHHIRISMTDRPLSEDRGALGNAFNRSSSNFVRGSALLLEGLGYVLPFALILSILASMGYIGTKLFRFKRNNPVVLIEERKLEKTEN